jgi:hypothetical protein
MAQGSAGQFVEYICKLHACELENSTILYIKVLNSLPSDLKFVPLLRCQLLKNDIDAEQPSKNVLHIQYVLGYVECQPK